MTNQIDPIKKLINALTKFPGIGEKTAIRLAYFLIHSPQEFYYDLVNAIKDVKQKIILCETCYAFTEINPCLICSNPVRDKSTILVIENSENRMRFEKIGEYKGIYHVLHGLLSPLSGVTPEHLKIKELVEKIKNKNITEIILALNSTAEGEATCVYISNLLARSEIKITRLGMGMPVGSNIEYLDPLTIEKAFKYRQEIK
jgi:recombination protein RecR